MIHGMPEDGEKMKRHEAAEMAMKEECPDCGMAMKEEYPDCGMPMSDCECK